MPLYPLLLDPIYKEKVWGGRSFERFDRTLPGGSETRFGESWELADLAVTAPSGGGGSEARSRVLNGPLMKRTLRDVLEQFGSLVTGAVSMAGDGGFPLLLKYLDARENLSVQVHPSSDFAKVRAGAVAKSEALYVVEAEPGAVIYKGLLPEVSRDDFEAAVEAGTVPDLLRQVPALPGDCHYIPGGLCHALGAGVVVAEVQTPSDTTYRVYDWDRTDRELHLEEALECMDFGIVDTRRFEPGTEHQEEGRRRRDLVDCEHFRIAEWVLDPESRLDLVFERATLLMVVRGRGAIAWGSDGRSLPLGAGATVLLPAALAGAAIRADGAMTVLRVDLPEPSAASRPEPR